jgi:hypothetical protein
MRRARPYRGENPEAAHSLGPEVICLTKIQGAKLGLAQAGSATFGPMADLRRYDRQIRPKVR